MSMAFSPPEQSAARVLVQLALAEDLGTAGDVTSAALAGANAVAEAVLVARVDGVVAGLDLVGMTCAAVDRDLVWTPQRTDGDRLTHGDVVGVVRGPLRSLLCAERTALNFVQRLSGVATATRRFVDAVVGTRAQILDTRKTTPGWRLLQKYAVRAGGGANHRIGLYDQILIKDNHLAGLGIADPRAQIAEALRRAREYRGRADPSLRIEIEVTSLDQLDAALELAAEIVLLDNMPADAMREAVRRRDARGARTLLEASGGVNLTTVRAIAETGVDRISVGALTHSAPALDLALDLR